MDCSTPGLLVHYKLLELAQTCTHWVGDAIQPSHPLSSPSPPAFNLSQHQGLFQWVSCLHQVAKGLDFHCDKVLGIHAMGWVVGRLSTELCRGQHCPWSSLLHLFRVQGLASFCEASSAPTGLDMPHKPFSFWTPLSLPDCMETALVRPRSSLLILPSSVKILFLPPYVFHWLLVYSSVLLLQPFDTFAEVP